MSENIWCVFVPVILKVEVSLPVELQMDISAPLVLKKYLFHYF